MECDWGFGPLWHQKEAHWAAFGADWPPWDANWHPQATQKALETHRSHVYHSHV